MKNFRVWYIPQVPWTPYRYDVSSVEEWRTVLKAIVWLSQFEYANRIKPDYADAAGLEVFVSTSTYWFDPVSLDDTILKEFRKEYWFEIEDIVENEEWIIGVWEEWMDDDTGETISDLL